MPDDTRQTFEASSDHGGSDDGDGRGVRYLEWSSDPDPDDSWTQTEYAFLLRNGDAPVQVVHETHRHGLFDRDDWLRLIADAGFEADVVNEVTSEAHTPRSFFVGHRPAG